MQIDWLTVAAQIVNFLVLVWLLQRFLYKPITGAMRRREARIEERLAEARTARKEAEDEAERLKEEQAKLDESKDAILDRAHKEAEKLRERLEAEIRDEMDEKRASWHDHLAEERDTFVALLKRKAGKKVLEISKQVLTDYADSDLSERVVTTFATRLQALGSDTCAKMRDAARETGGAATVFSATTIDSAAKARITRTIHDILSANIDVTYREDPEMVLGVRLMIGDYSAEWSAASYFKRLESELGEMIDNESQGSGSAVGAPGTKARETA